MARVLRPILFLVAVYAAAALVTARPANPGLFPARGAEPRVTLYVTADAVHSNLVLPTALLTARPGPLAEAVARLKPGAWTSIGWGDAAFYQGSGWSPARIADLARAFFKPGNPSVMLLAEKAAPADDLSHPVTLKLTLSRRGFEAMAERLDHAFELEDERPVPIGAPAAAPSGLFFKSNGFFFVGHVCNQWTGEMLHAAGAPITPLADPPSFGLEQDLILRAHAVRVPFGGS